MEISAEARSIIGVILITVPFIEFGGLFLLSRLRSGVSIPNPVQTSYFRAGHAHAGVLVILAIIAQLLVDVTDFSGAVAYAVRAGFFLAPIFIPAGFFLGAPTEAESTRPGSLINLIYIGAALLAISAVVLGVGLLTASA